MEVENRHWTRIRFVFNGYTQDVILKSMTMTKNGLGDIIRYNWDLLNEKEHKWHKDNHPGDYAYSIMRIPLDRHNAVFIMDDGEFPESIYT